MDRPLSQPQQGSLRFAHHPSSSSPARETSSYPLDDASAASGPEVEAGCHGAALLAAAGIIRWLVDHRQHPAPGSSGSSGSGGPADDGTTHHTLEDSSERTRFHEEGRLVEARSSLGLSDDDGQAQAAVSGVLAWLRDRGHHQPPHPLTPMLHPVEPSSQHHSQSLENTWPDGWIFGSNSGSGNGSVPKCSDAEEKEAEDEERCCSVCMERLRGVLLAPCGHAPVCVACCEGIRRSSNKVRTRQCYQNLSVNSMHPYAMHASYVYYTIQCTQVIAPLPRRRQQLGSDDQHRPGDVSTPPSIYCRRIFSAP